MALARGGADLAVNDVAREGTRNAAERVTVEDEIGWEGLPSLVAEIEAVGRRAVAIVGDVGTAADAQRMVTQAVEALGGVDILVNNAGAPTARTGGSAGRSRRTPSPTWSGSTRSVCSS